MIRCSFLPSSHLFVSVSSSHLVFLSLFFFLIFSARFSLDTLTYKLSLFAYHTLLLCLYASCEQHISSSPSGTFSISRFHFRCLSLIFSSSQFTYTNSECEMKRNKEVNASPLHSFSSSLINLNDNNDSFWGLRNNTIPGIQIRICFLHFSITNIC